MAADSSVMDVIAAAVATSPENIPLRLHLAELLLNGNRAGEALQQCQAALDAEPDDLSALRLAARAAMALGDTQKAGRFQRLADALSCAEAYKEAPAHASVQTADDAKSTDDEGHHADDDDTPPRPKVASLRLVDGGLAEGNWAVEKTTLNLADVAGMDQVKRRLNLAFLAPLRNPDMMKMYGKNLRGGLMLYGPPGCGKTFIARATAGEMGARFVSIGLSDVLDMYIGQSERNLHEIFETARRNAPCVLFFDEIDALGRKRSQMRNSAGREVVNQLLAELDNVNNDNHGVFVLAATNHPWDVDSALRRPGRFDRTLLVLPPDGSARETIIRYHLSAKPVEGVDISWLGGKTEGYSGADLAHLCESAAELAMEESMASGKPRPLSQADFKSALKDVKASTRPWFETARNYAMFANEGGAYDELLEHLRGMRLV
jgi:SpoVK/Ycf46/Vps4 family AAA+-type ATPase